MKIAITLMVSGLAIAASVWLGVLPPNHAEQAEPIPYPPESQTSNSSDSLNSKTALEAATETTRSALEAAEPGAHALEPVLPPAMPEPRAGLSPEDVQAVRDNLDRLYGNAVQEVLVEGYRERVARLPKGLIPELHQRRIDAGNYEVLNVPPVKPGEPFSPPRVKASPLAHGLVAVSPLKDGRVVKTVLDLEELGLHAATAVELGWLELAIARARRAERESH